MSSIAQIRAAMDNLTIDPPDVDRMKQETGRAVDAHMLGGIREIVDRLDGLTSLYHQYLDKRTEAYISVRGAAEKYGARVEMEMPAHKLLQEVSDIIRAWDTFNKALFAHEIAFFERSGGNPRRVWHRSLEAMKRFQEQRDAWSARAIPPDDILEQAAEARAALHDPVILQHFDRNPILQNPY